jgi:uncharacterized membrane protein
MPPLYLLHPPVVHFPIALLTLGFAGALAGALSERWARLTDAVSWLLWLGTASAWAALALGLLAARTAPHVPPAWETLALHKTLGFWTVGVFSVLSLWRALRPAKWPALFLALWAAGAALVLATGYQGGELVFKHSMGVAAE